MADLGLFDIMYSKAESVRMRYITALATLFFFSYQNFCSYIRLIFHFQGIASQSVNGAWYKYRPEICTDDYKEFKKIIRCQSNLTEKPCVGRYDIIEGIVKCMCYENYKKHLKLVYYPMSSYISSPIQ